MLGSDNLSCPLHVQIKAADKICVHYIRYGYNTYGVTRIFTVSGSMVDPRRFFPDPDPTFQIVLDPDAVTVSDPVNDFFNIPGKYLLHNFYLFIPVLLSVKRFIFQLIFMSFCRM